MPSGSSGKNSGSKSAKAIKKASQKKGPSGTKLGNKRQIPWLTVGAVVAVVALIAVLGINLYPKYQDRQEAQKFAPTEENQDPSTGIEGVVVQQYPAALHVAATQRVAYDRTPPFGGPHDGVWADCMGTVYPNAVRTENMVHGLEHGAVWITYDPDALDEDQIDQLATKVDGQQYTMMSPYPGQPTPVSLQSWGHQLQLDSVDDERIDHFIAALRLNRYQYPEVGASCSTTPATFDVANPPPFDPTPPGPDAVPMDGEGIAPDTSELGGAGAGGMQLPEGLPDDLQQQLQQLPSDGAPAQAPAPAPAP